MFGAGVKKQYEGFALQVGELDLIAALVGQAEAGSLVARVRDARTLSVCPDAAALVGGFSVDWVATRDWSFL